MEDPRVTWRILELHGGYNIEGLRSRVTWRLPELHGGYYIRVTWRLLELYMEVTLS